MEKLLLIDACISTHNSRTKRLAAAYIDEYMKHHEDVVLETAVLRAGRVEPLTKERISERDGYIASMDFDQPMFDFARQFKEADHVVVATPYWDLSFPSILKVYIENIVVDKLTFTATETGFAGLCGSKKITYITTAGGFIGDRNFGFDYIKGMAAMLCGSAETEFISAEGLDIQGMDIDSIMEDAVKKAAEAAKK